MIAFKFNSAQLLNWRWGFVKNLRALWVKVVKYLHAEGGRFIGGDDGVGVMGVWSSIV